MRSWDTPRDSVVTNLCMRVSRGDDVVAATRWPTRSTRRAGPCRASSATTTRAGATRGCSRCSTGSPRAALPVDLAVIPAELDAGLARELRARPRVGLHQHGLAHVNHEREGRRCEFGPARGAAAQRRDIEAGRARLADLLGERVDPIFTPPWNRCTADTGRCLAELGFAALSREARAAPLDVPRAAGAAGQRRLVRPPPRRAAEPGRARRPDRRGDRRRRARSA